MQLEKSLKPNESSERSYMTDKAYSDDYDDSGIEEKDGGFALKTSKKSTKF